jgi:hypothetical protein
MAALAFQRIRKTRRRRVRRGITGTERTVCVAQFVPALVVWRMAPPLPTALASMGPIAAQQQDSRGHPPAARSEEV